MASGAGPWCSRLTIGETVAIHRFGLPLLGAISACRLKTLHLSSRVFNFELGFSARGTEISEISFFFWPKLFEIVTVLNEFEQNLIKFKKFAKKNQKIWVRCELAGGGQNYRNFKPCFPAWFWTADSVSVSVLGAPSWNPWSSRTVRFEFSQIVCGTLKSLAIHDCSGRDALAVTAPKLTSFRLWYSVIGLVVFLVDEMDSLVEASN